MYYDKKKTKDKIVFVKILLIKRKDFNFYSIFCWKEYCLMIDTFKVYYGKSSRPDHLLLSLDSDVH